MPSTCNIILDFARSSRPSQPHTFEFVPQVYSLRSPGGGLESAEFPWTPELLADLRGVRGPHDDAELVARIGELLRTFLASAGWSHHERTIMQAAHQGAEIVLTIRSTAAELYALPWEFATLKYSGQPIGSVPGLLIRYEWPEIMSFPDRFAAATRRGRVLFAWSAAGGAVPAGAHFTALTNAFTDLPEAFDPQRDVLAHATFASIDQALVEANKSGRPVDAVHILCHGATIGASYGLVLDDESAQGRAVVVDAGRMQQLLAPHVGMVRLVVLNACESGHSGEVGNLLGSVAQRVHRAGMQAVVASRFPLSPAASSQFTAAFYAELAREHSSLEAAFLTARDALRRDPTQLHWASIQLYSHQADGDATHPLRLRLPPGTIARSTRIDAAVQAVDIAETLLEAGGLARTEDVENAEKLVGLVAQVAIPAARPPGPPPTVQTDPAPVPSRRGKRALLTLVLAGAGVLTQRIGARNWEEPAGTTEPQITAVSSEPPSTAPLPTTKASPALADPPTAELTMDPSPMKPTPTPEPITGDAKRRGSTPKKPPLSATADPEPAEPPPEPEPGPTTVLVSVGACTLSLPALPQATALTAAITAKQWRDAEAAADDLSREAKGATKNLLHAALAALQGISSRESDIKRELAAAAGRNPSQREQTCLDTLNRQLQ